jgi:hypothetical protein
LQIQKDNLAMSFRGIQLHFKIGRKSVATCRRWNRSLTDQEKNL